MPEKTETEVKTIAAQPPEFEALPVLGSRTLSGLSVALASSRLDRHGALELHRDVYSRKGLLPESTVKPQVLPQACAPGSAIFVAKENDAIVGTISFYMDSAIGLPMDGVHGEEVDQMRARFARVAEVGGLAVREDRRNVGIMIELFHATFRWAAATSAQCIVACVNPSSRRTYSRLLLFEILGECKQHPRFLGAPSIPIGLNLTTVARRWRDLYGAKPDRRSNNFHLDAALPCAYFASHAAHYLQWSDEEVSEMIRTRQLTLAGHDRLYIEQHYSTEMTGSPG